MPPLLDSRPDRFPAPSRRQPTAPAWTEVNSTEIAYFDRHVEQAGEFNPFADRGWTTLRRRFEQWLPTEAPVQLLDVGCGTGMSRQLYEGRCRRYVGIDLSRTALHAAQHRFGRASWLQADACTLPFAPSTFDVVAFSSVLHHIPDFERALHEAVRVLRPGGWVFAFDPNALHPAMALFRHTRSPLYLKQGVSPNECPLLPGRLRQAFTNSGLIDIRQRCQSDIPYREVAPRLLNACLSLYNAADWCWERIGLGRRFGTFVLTAGSKPSA